MEVQHLNAIAPLVAGLPTATTGWLIAGSVLVAVRLGRQQAATERTKQLQGNSENTLEAELKAMLRQQIQERGRAQRAAELARQRLQEARQRAAEQEAGRQAENQKLLEAAAKQRELAEGARAAERQAYEQREAELKAELKQRTERERQIRAEKLAAQQAEQVELRRAAEERSRQQELVRQQEIQEQLRLQKLEQERKAAERKEIQRLSTVFSIVLDGAITLSLPPEGSQTQGRLPKAALVQLDMSVGSLLGGSGLYGPVVFESPTALEEQLHFQLAAAAAQGASAFAAAARLQKMTNEPAFSLSGSKSSWSQPDDAQTLKGPLMWMPEAELTYWMRTASTHTALHVAPAIKPLLRQFSGQRSSLSHSFEVRTRRGVLPEGDPRRTSRVLQAVVDAIDAGSLDAAKASLKSFVADEEAAFIQDGKMLEDSKHLVPVLALALFLDLVEAPTSSDSTNTATRTELAAELACSIISENVQGAPEDSLSNAEGLLHAVLPEQNVLNRHFAALAQSNQSSQTKARLKQQEELLQAELAERLVEFEWPDRSELAASRQAEIESSTPIPERIWALRNVGSTLAIGGAGERRRARLLLERAVQLKRDLIGSRRHPGIMPELEALANLLELEPEWERDAAALRGVLLALLTSIAELFVQSGDSASAVVLLEAAVRRVEEALGLRQAEVVAATKRANDLFETLNDADRAQVAAARRRKGTVDGVIKKFEEQIASQQTPGSLQNFECWNEGGVGWLGRLV